LLSTTFAQSFCGSLNDDECIEVDFSKLSESYESIDGNQFLRSGNLHQLDDALATKSDPGDWKLNDNFKLVESSRSERL
jgi:hypothetical protein